MVKFVNLAAQYAGLPYQDVMGCIRAGQFIGSQMFEKRFAEYHQDEKDPQLSCVGLGSGLDALWLSLKALGVGPGDQVIVPANTYIATAFAVSHVGATPVFADVDPDGYVITTETIEAVRTNRTVAIIPVHLYGQPCDMWSIMKYADKYNLLVIEDCAQAAGASVFDKKIGTFGSIGCFSFYPTKNLGGLGQGGAIITRSPDLAKVVREMGNVGRSTGSWHEYNHIGFNSRLDAVNAKFLETNLRFLDQWNSKRIELANLYETALADVAEVFTPPAPNEMCTPVYHLYELKLKDKTTRDELATYLNAQGIETGLHYPIPCHKQPVYSHLELLAPCPNAEMLSDCLLSLPIHPKMTNDEVLLVCIKIHDFFKNRIVEIPIPKKKRGRKKKTEVVEETPKKTRKPRAKKVAKD